MIATAIAIDEFAKVICRGGAGLVVSSQTGYMMDFTPEIENQLAMIPTDELAELDFVKKDAVANPGIIVTPLAYDEFNAAGDG